MRVPTYDNLRTAPSGVPGNAFAGPSGPNAGQIAGEQAQQLGAGLQRTGDAVSHIALQMADQVNQTRVNDAVNKAREAAQNLAYNPQTGFLNLKGDAALTRPDGQDLPTEYGGKLREHLGDIAGTLGNDEQRRQFQANASDLMTQFHGQLETHMLGEFRNYALSVQDGTINLATDDAKRNWSTPDLIAPSLNAAKAAVVEKGRVSGWSGAQTDAALLATTSKVHTDVISSALENGNPNYALGYLNARKGEMTADDILRVQGHVNQQVWMGQAMGAVQSATRAAMPAIAPTNFDRMVQITASAESGGRETNADGSTVTSPKGAQGVMQVMPATNKDPGFGVRPAADDSPGERARVGRDYLQAMLQRYGDPAKAWAAYNAGPGALDKAVADSAVDATRGAYRSPGGQPADDWLSRLPKETQAYVAGNLKSMQGSGGQPPRPTELDFVNNALAQLPPGAPPQVVKMTRDQAAGQFAMINKSMNETGENAVADVQRFVANNPGATLAQVPAALLDRVKQFAPGKLDDLDTYSKKLQRGDTVTDLTLYNRLAAHPEEMTAMSDAQFEMLRAHLAPADFKHFSNERANALNGSTDDTSGGINSKALSQALTTRLEALGINTAPAPKDTAGRERLGAIQQFVRNSVFAQQQQIGKKMTPLELDAHVDGLFAKNAQFQNTFMGVNLSPRQSEVKDLLLGFKAGSGGAVPLMAMQVSDIPSDALQQLRASFAARGKAAPTNTDLINAFRRAQIQLPNPPGQPTLPAQGGATDGLVERVLNTLQHPLDFLSSGVGRGNRENDEPNF